ncbi:MAG: hypothetical protein E6J90_35490 [Deltaproteobacteria bacterium]|nr:MAG: hypothetical protein E6J90_35490 [Deltaproteobacteria bacterium]
MDLTRALRFSDQRVAGWSARAGRRPAASCQLIERIASVNAVVVLRALPLLVLVSTACSTQFTAQPCSIDGDCGGLVCELRNLQPVCVDPEEATLTIGESAPATGANQALGTGMKAGIELAFREQNAAGGINGRQLVLDFRDDGYVPEQAEANVRSLLDVQVSATEMPRCPSTSAMLAGGTPVSATRLTRGPKAVLAILGDVGTPTMLRAAPVAIETGTVFFGAFTGASTLLRDTAAGDCARYIFNVRASYAQEAQATVEYFKKVGITGYQRLISFDQADSFGQAGYDGLVTATRNTMGPFPTGIDSVTPIYRVRYVRNDDSSVPAQAVTTEGYLGQLLANDTTGNPIAVGIMMTDTYGAGTEYIKALRTWQYDGQAAPAGKATRLKLYFSNVSFVGPNTLAERLRDLGKVPGSATANFVDSVVISQVVPNYQGDLSKVRRPRSRRSRATSRLRCSSRASRRTGGRSPPSRSSTRSRPCPTPGSGSARRRGSPRRTTSTPTRCGARSSSRTARSRICISGAQGLQFSSLNEAASHEPAAPGSGGPRARPAADLGR